MRPMPRGETCRNTAKQKYEAYAERRNVLPMPTGETCSGLIVTCAGAPAKGVPGLNTDRRGALHDARNALCQHAPRILGRVSHGPKSIS